MKVLAIGFLLSCSLGESARGGSRKNAITKEDRKFWHRLLEDDFCFSTTPPKQPPAVAPTPPPSAAPIPPSTAPTFPPSKASKGGVQPKGVQTCQIDALISCELILDSDNKGKCENVMNPLNVFCTGDDTLTSLSFIYKAKKCGSEKEGIECVDQTSSPLPPEVFVEIRIEAETLTFVAQTSQNNNQFFVADAVFDDFTNITIFSNAADGAGQLLQTLAIDTRCQSNNPVLNLGDKFGALELAGFENAEGTFSSIYSYQMSYVAKNGLRRAILNNGFVKENFFDREEFEVVEAPVVLGISEEYPVYQSATIVNVADKFRHNKFFQFTFEVEGAAATGGFPCSDDTVLIL
jgi:hypothetical protein